jgi:CheY-like chemotaxis protein
MMMKKILLIEDNEDNEDNAFLFRSLLSLRDIEFLEANTGIEGVAMAKSEKPDLILMDIQLPDINGLEATKQIRTALGDKIPILAVTSYAMTGDREKCLAAGCNGYIEKPINPETFLQEIDSYM